MLKMQNNRTMKVMCVINRNSSKVTALNFLTFGNSKLNEKNEIILRIIQYSRFNYN